MLWLFDSWDFKDKVNYIHEMTLRLNVSDRNLVTGFHRSKHSCYGTRWCASLWDCIVSNLKLTTKNLKTFAEVLYIGFVRV